MRVFKTTAFLGLAACVAVLAYAESPKEDFLAEMKKCAVCNVMVDKPELMKDMTWETHKIENGMLCVASVPKELKKDFDAVHAEMTRRIEKVKADAQQGKHAELCGFCQGMGDLEKAGAKSQDVKTATGSIHLVTSNDPSIVAKIHAQADKAIAEQKKMQESHQVSAAN
jgi:hypothetical protein